MARSIAEIKQVMLDAVAADPVLSALNSTSQVAKWNLFLWIVAVCINIFEQLQDLFKTDLQNLALSAVPGTPIWIQSQTLKFQYSATDPQIVTLVNFYPQYPSIRSDYQIITRCSVKQSSGRRVIIKVAKGISPNLVALLTPELNALISYINKIKFAGTSIDVISLQADRIKIGATIYFDGQYVQSVVQINIIAAINNYLLNIPFDGVLTLTKLISAIEAVAGVQDIVLVNVVARENAVAYGSSQSTVLMVGSLEQQRLYETVAGYVIQEDTIGQTLIDTLNFVAV